LANRKDDEAIASLINCGNPKSPKFPSTKTDINSKEIQEVLRDKLSRK